MVRDVVCHDVATSINGFHFVLVDVGHHLEVGRVSRSDHASLVAGGRVARSWLARHSDLYGLRGQLRSAAHAWPVSRASDVGVSTRIL